MTKKTPGMTKHHGMIKLKLNTYFFFKKTEEFNEKFNNVIRNMHFV